MKKMIIILMTACLSLTLLPVQSGAKNIPVNNTVVLSDSTKAMALLKRLYEINDMDKSNLKPEEKKKLKKEVLSIRDELKQTSNGIYLSVGAIIIILLILILIT